MDYYKESRLVTQNAAENSLQEGLITRVASVSMKSTDKELSDTATQWITEAKPVRDQFFKRQQRNERYYIGDQLKDIRLSQYSARIILNKVWQSLETVIPRAANRLPGPQVSLPHEEDQAKQIDSRKYCLNIENIMIGLATSPSISLPFKLKEFAIFHELYYLGVLKWGCEEIDGNVCIWVENVRAQRILLPPGQCKDYVIEYHEDSLDYLYEKFPKKKKGA